jgi:hypothetical protein
MSAATDDRPMDIEAVRKKELEYIRRRRQVPGEHPPTMDDVSDSLVGLAFSGGGIRSATTNLGIAQALSRMGILRLVDYLSTVSGGGYIGGCLSALWSVNQKHQSNAGTDEQFSFTSRHDLRFSTEWEKFPFNPERKVVANAHGQQAAFGLGTKLVAHLRTHGDFLIARRSILKRDALRAVGNLVGGVLYTLVLATLSLAVATLLLLGGAHVLSPDVVTWKSLDVQASRASSELQYTRAGEVFPTVTVRQATDPALSEHLGRRVGLIWDSMTRDIGTRDTTFPFFSGVVVTLIVAVIFMAAIKWWKGPAKWLPGESREDAFEVRLLKLAALLVTLTVITVPIVTAQVDGRGTTPSWLLQPFFVVAGTYLSAVLLYGAFALFGSAKFFWTRGTRSLGGSYLAITMYGTIVALLFALLPAASYAAYAVGIGGVLAPIVSLVVGRLLMMRPVHRTAERFAITKTLLHILLAIVVALLITLTMIEMGALAIDAGVVNPLESGGGYWAALIGFTALLLLLCLFVNLNRIGLHYFYRDRILETYLRTEIASEEANEKNGRMETFVDTMEMRLADIHGNQEKDSTGGPGQPGTPGNSAPYLLVSAALNLAGSRDLTRKDRKSGYFLFSKYFCGSRQTGYRETEDYNRGKTQLARALTVSGAAAGTGMGYQTFFAQSFLTALFNIRLGQWVANPRWKKSRDRLVFWPKYVLWEALGHTKESTRLVNVSDGGHTGDNVGIYPLLERRCQVIIACDAEADNTLAFGSFTEALRHAYVDLGVDVDIDLSMILPDPPTGLSKAHCAIGRIRYPECPHRPSWLIYMKNSLTGNEPAAIQNYKRRCSDFPHESTADQFFDDAQFESYRVLGDHIAEETFSRFMQDAEVRHALFPGEQKRPPRCDKEFRVPMKKPRLVWDQLRVYHSPFRAAENTKFRELTHQVAELEKLFIASPELRWYYLESMSLPAEGDVRNQPRVDPVNVITMQIQLMEDTYFALRLDQYANARDNRGWMNLFRRWGGSPTFKTYFAKLQTNYSNDFVLFYYDFIEGWGTIDEFPLPHAWDLTDGTPDEYMHPAAKESIRRRTPGLFQDAGRREAREPKPGTPTVRAVDHPMPDQHGDTGLTTESRPPTSEPKNE